MPEFRAKRIQRERDWDYAQANDDAIMDADPHIAQVTDAARLLDRDPGRAFALLLGLASEGSVWSMVHLGWCYNVGCGTPVSLADAEHWYRLAHEAGCDRALIDYARLLRNRGAVEEAAEVYAAGVARDWAPALYAAAMLAPSKARTREQRLAQKSLLERAADHGRPMARQVLAGLLLTGYFGLRYVPAGIRLTPLAISALLDASGEEAEQIEPQVRPSGATLH